MTTDTIVISLLDSTSIQQCEKLANNVDLPGKRAKALLILNNGESNKAAAEKSGLSSGQVSYVFSRFNKIGMEMFNASSTKKAAVKKSVTKKVAAKKAKPVADIDTMETVETDDANKELASDPVKTKDKKKKSKKSSKKDNAKKESKKDKKGKKSGKKGKSKNKK